MRPCTTVIAQPRLFSFSVRAGVRTLRKRLGELEVASIDLALAVSLQ